MPRLFALELLDDSVHLLGGIHGPRRLLAWSPTRYAGLDLRASGTEPNDVLSYDVFSQAGTAVTCPVGVDIMRGLPAQRVIASGVSQSQGRLVTYYNSQTLRVLTDGALIPGGDKPG